MIRLVAFDLDGTIGDTIPLCLAAFQRGDYSLCRS